MCMQITRFAHDLYQPVHPSRTVKDVLYVANVLHSVCIAAVAAAAGDED
jgi:hypothetical protein